MAEDISSPVVVARIVKAHGIRGEVILESFTDVEGRLENGRTFLLVKEGVVQRQIRVESRRFLRGRHAFKFSGISTRSQAEDLRGLDLAIPDEELGSLNPDQFFIHQLIGMRVRLRDGKLIGVVQNVWKTGGVDLLEVGEKGEILIPFTSEICVDVDTSNRVITIAPPEGLLRLNAR